MDRAICQKPKRAKGMTMVEAIITLSIAAVLTALAAPNLTEIIQNNRSVTLISDLQVALNYARSEAIMRNTNVALCHTHDGEICHLGNNWKPGWIVFVDIDLDGFIDVNDTVLRVHGGLIGDSRLMFTANKVNFSSNGLATSGINGTFTLCDNRGASHSRGLIIGAGGRTRVAVDSDSNGTPEDAANNDLTCLL